MVQLTPPELGLDSEVKWGHLFLKASMFSFPPTATFAPRKNSQGGKLHVRALLRYRTCDNGAATFQHLQIFNHAGRNANRIVFTAKCLLNGRVAFAKQASAFPSSLLFPFSSSFALCS